MNMKFAIAGMALLCSGLGAAAKAQDTAKPVAKKPPVVSTQRFQDWNHRCADVELGEGKSAQQCEVVQVARVKQGEEEVSLLTLAIAKTDAGVAPSKPKGDAALLLTALVPLNVYLPAGFGLEADGKAIADVAYRNCNQTGCWVQQRLDVTMLKALQKSQAGAARLRLINGQNVTIRFSLKGLTAALNKLTKLAADK